MNRNSLPMEAEGTALRARRATWGQRCCRAGLILIVAAGTLSWPSQPQAATEQGRRHKEQRKEERPASRPARRAQSQIPPAPPPEKLVSTPTRIHKCRQAEGRILYSQQPCAAPGAEDAVRHVSDLRTPEQQRQGQAAKARTVKLGQAMQAEREAMERQSRNRRAMALTVRDPQDKGTRQGPRASARPGRGKDPGTRRPADARKAGADKAGLSKPLRPADFTAKVPRTATSRQPPGDTP